MTQSTRSEKLLTARRRTILAAAARLFARDGYAAISMRDLAEEIGITPAALYHHFPDKEALYCGVLEFVFAEKAMTSSALLQGDEAPEVRLERFIAWLVDMFSSDEISTRLLHRELLDGNDERLRFLAREVIEAPYREIEKLMRQLAPERDADLLGISVVSLVLGHYELLPMFKHLTGRKDNKKERAKLVAHVKELVFRGLAIPLRHDEEG